MTCGGATSTSVNPSRKIFAVVPKPTGAVVSPTLTASHSTGLSALTRFCGGTM